MPAQANRNDRRGRASGVAAALRRAWHTGWLPRPDLDRLKAKAAELEGEGAWREALDCLIESLRSEARLNEVGLTFAYVQIARLLEQRRRAQELWRERPDIAAVPVTRPIVVLGHMRSGTTRLQRLLGCDPRLNHTRFYEVTSPLPPQPDWRLLESWAQLRLIDFLNPEIHRVHPSSPRAVEEVFGLLAVSFYGAQFEAQWRVPGFARWWEGQDRSWVYSELRHLIQTIAWQRGAAPAPWVLKAPQFMEDLDALLAAFPDARLLCLSREPDAVVASTASLVCHQMQVQSDAVDPCWIGQEWLRKTARREALCAQVRAERGDVPQLDVDFAAVSDDWRGEMRRVYDFLGIPFTPAIEQRMARYLHEAEGSGFRRHSYRSADFGLEREEVRRAVAAAAVA